MEVIVTARSHYLNSVFRGKSYDYNLLAPRFCFPYQPSGDQSACLFLNMLEKSNYN